MGNSEGKEVFPAWEYIAVNKEELIEQFLKENPQYKAKRNQLEVSIYERSWDIKLGKKTVDISPFIDNNQKFIEVGRTYGYCRISRKEQSIDRQIRNIKAEYPNAIIVQEAFTGTTMDRPEWNKIYKKLKPGDRIVFDSVSRMSRSADEGVEMYFDLYENGIQLVFLKEHYIDTSVYAENIKDKIELQGTDEDEIFKGLNNYFRKLAERQIRIVFEQADKEVQDLHQRTKEGIETARLNGKQIGCPTGIKKTTKKSIEMKEKIKKMNKEFDGNMNDKDCMEILKLARNTFYKYKRELSNNGIEV